MRRRQVVASSLLGCGALIVLIAVVHLAMTVEIAGIVRRNTSPAAFAFLWPPYDLDHIAVGVLMVGLGATLAASAQGVRAGDSLAWRIAVIDALTILALSPAILFTVGLRYFDDAPAFAFAAAVIGVVGIVALLLLLWGRRGPG